MKGRSKGRN